MTNMDNSGEDRDASAPTADDDVSGRPAVSPIVSKRRAEITAAAAKVFAECGYHSAGMREIAEAVGMRGASLYNHFSSKELILYTIALQMTKDPVEQHLPVLDAPGTPSSRLAQLIGLHIAHLADNRVAHLVSLNEFTALTPEHQQEILGYRRHYQRRVGDVIAAGCATDEFCVNDARRAAVAILDMINGISWWLRDGYDIVALADTYVSLAVDGILQSARQRGTT
jgi:AcrR family transcriptional regulator